MLYYSLTATGVLNFSDYTYTILLKVTFLMQNFYDAVIGLSLEDPSTSSTTVHLRLSRQINTYNYINYYSCYIF